MCCRRTGPLPDNRPDGRRAALSIIGAMKKSFIDETGIVVVGGDGGDGIVSFLRERGKPFGGPNGGDGGKGGDVRILADRRVKTLLELGRRRRVAAGRGGHGGGGDCNGAGGKDVMLRAPVGTRIYDGDTGALHIDLMRDGQVCLLAGGGRGGLGNRHFKSATNRAPRRRTEGETGEERYFRLELRLLADVGLIGLPNAGKSSLLRALSAARPKVASYPFTTLTPQLGVIDSGDGDAVTIADVPGLIRGAASGAGLGARFLRHLTRTALLCHVVDMSAEDPVADCLQVHNELEEDDAPLAGKPRWLVLNKSDLLTAESRQKCRDTMRSRFPHFARVYVVSALAGEGAPSFSRDLLRHYAADTV